MKRIMLFAVALLLSAKVVADAPPRVIEDPAGDVGSRDNIGNVYVVVPEIDMLWVDITPGPDAIEVEIHVTDLSHRTFGDPLENLQFLLAATLVRDGSFVKYVYMIAEVRTFPPSYPFRNQTTIHFDNTSDSTLVPGEFDWTNNTVRGFLPRSAFESGDVLRAPVVWARAYSWAVPVFTNVQIADRAPNVDWGKDVTIP